jgi:hypothetical protein
MNKYIVEWMNRVGQYEQLYACCTPLMRGGTKELARPSETENKQKRCASGSNERIQGPPSQGGWSAAHANR